MTWLFNRRNYGLAHFTGDFEVRTMSQDVSSARVRIYAGNNEAMVFTVSPTVGEAAGGATAEIQILVNNASIPDGTIQLTSSAKSARTFNLNNVHTIDLVFNDEWGFFTGNYAINVLF